MLQGAVAGFGCCRFWPQMRDGLLSAQQARLPHMQLLKASCRLRIASAFNPQSCRHLI